MYIMGAYILVVIFIILFAMVVLQICNTEAYQNIEWNAQYLKHKASCFSCEKDMIGRYGTEAAWMGQPTKSFDAERYDGFLAKTMRWY
jgi:hypothetical protein